MNFGFFNPFESSNGDSSGGTIDLSEYAKKEDLVGLKTTEGGEIFNDYENNIATTNSHAEGSGTKASSENQHVQGKYNVEDSESKYAFIIGNGEDDNNRSNAFAIDWSGLIYQNNSENGFDLSNFITIDNSVGQKTAEGGEIFNDYENNKAASKSHAEGNGSKALGPDSHAEGYYTKATGRSSHAEGNGTKALGKCSHAEGGSDFNNAPHPIAEGTGSHAEGYLNTKAYGNGSHAEGSGTTAGKKTENNGTITYGGHYSHAEGSGTTASGTSSHAEGDSTTASGSGSHAEGIGSTASGQSSHAEGFWTKASSNYQHVQGKFNVEDVDGKYAFIIGNGENSNNRSNAFAIDWNGLIYLNNSDVGIDLTNLTTKEEVAQAIEYAHTHQNKTTLDRITAEKFESWEAAVQQIGDIQTALENIVEVSE